MNNIDFINSFIAGQKGTSAKKLWKPVPKPPVGGDLADHDISNAPRTAEEETIINFLSRLLLLDNVPLNYLVPHPNLLPPESIRFFTMDMEWLNHLMMGALSLGAGHEFDTAVDTWVNELLCVHGAVQMHGHIPKNVLGPVLQKYLPVAETTLLAASHDQASDAANALGDKKDAIYKKQIYGFIIRSEFVSKYPGVKVKAYSGSDPNPEEEKSPLHTISIEGNVKFCLFDGPCGLFVFYENTGALSFGFDANTGGLTKTLRDKPVQQANEKVGTQGERTIEKIPFKDEAAGVLDIKALSDAIQQKTNDQLFDSAYFAYYMLQGAENVQFKITQ